MQHTPGVLISFVIIMLMIALTAMRMDSSPSSSNHSSIAETAATGALVAGAVSLAIGNRGDRVLEDAVEGGLAAALLQRIIR